MILHKHALVHKCNIQLEFMELAQNNEQSPPSTCATKGSPTLAGTKSMANGHSHRDCSSPVCTFATNCTTYAVNVSTLLHAKARVILSLGAMLNPRNNAGNMYYHASTFQAPNNSEIDPCWKQTCSARSPAVNRLKGCRLLQVYCQNNSYSRLLRL